MEQGSMRCDVNTSLTPKGAGEWGTRTETKNVNSLRSVERAVRSEMVRQAQVLDQGGRIVQETRHFHEDTATTTSGRSKEEATDYRYFPEPDLVPVAPDPAWVEELRSALPDPPSVQRAKRQAQLGLSDDELSWLVNSGALDLFVETVAAGASSADARKWWLGDLARRANAEDVELSQLAVTPKQVARLARLVADGKINDRLARQVLDGVLAGEGEPEAVVAARGLAVVSDTGALDVAVDTAIAENPDVVAKIRSGKVAAVGVLLGSVMKATRGQADAASVKAMIAQRLGIDL
jgi:aspartyl-tRNA(Asn)/glutamyl-tRNA(Gln) amidotransferase subunit B